MIKKVDRSNPESMKNAFAGKHINTMEGDYNPMAKEVVWCKRGDFPYAEIKRQAENALYQVYPNQWQFAIPL